MWVLSYLKAIEQSKNFRNSLTFQESFLRSKIYVKFSVEPLP
ncbi:hypothetical protein CKA32_003417 [Geitlerinema sp. FC II]|nr:hypothetical protein CKA32_003417 [Geitlerinema sp. FC II]